MGGMVIEQGHQAGAFGEYQEKLEKMNDKKVGIETKTTGDIERKEGMTGQKKLGRYSEKMGPI